MDSKAVRNNFQAEISPIEHISSCIWTTFSILFLNHSYRFQPSINIGLLFQPFIYNFQLLVQSRAFYIITIKTPLLTQQVVLTFWACVAATEPGHLAVNRELFYILKYSTEKCEAICPRA